MDFDIFLPFRIPVKIFKVIGFWQTSKSSWSYTAFGIIFHLIFVELFAVLLFGYLFIFEAFDDLIDLMSLLPTCIGLCFKSAGLIYHIDEIEELFEALQMNLVNKKFTETFKNHVRSLDKLFKAIWGPALISCLLGSVSLFLHHKLPLRMWLPFDIANNAFGFWISAFYQIIVSSTMCGASIAIDMFPFFFMGYIIEMLQQLHVRLENLKNHEVPFLEKLIAKDRRNSTVSELKLCINYQVSILKITRKFERIFSKILLVQGLMATVILCTTAFTLSRISPTQDASTFGKLLIYLLTNVMVIFLPSYYGTLIAHSSGKLSETLFHTDWIDENLYYKGIVKIFMEFDKKPVTILSMGVFAINFENFRILCNSAYSFYAVFKRIS